MTRTVLGTPEEEPQGENEHPRSLRARRERMRRTQEEVAAAIGVSLSTYQRWERSERTPHLRMQRRIATYFWISYIELSALFPDRAVCSDDVHDAL